MFLLYSVGHRAVMLQLLTTL